LHRPASGALREIYGQPEGESIGYAPHENIIDDLIMQDYADYPVGMKIDWAEFQACIHRGVITPGVVVYIPGGRPCVVRGVYGNERIEAVG